MRVLTALLLLTPDVAYAHGTLRKSAPASGSRLDAVPRELRLTFSETPELAVTRIELVGPDGQPLRLNALRAAIDSPQVIITRIAAPMQAGRYQVRWQISGKDGHPVRGTFAFSVAPNAARLGAMPDAEEASPPASAAGTGTTANERALPPARSTETVPPSGPGDTFDAESVPYVAVRAVTYAAMLVVIGAVAFHFLVIGTLRLFRVAHSTMFTSADRRAAYLAHVAAVVLVFTAVLRLLMQAYALRSGEAMPDAAFIASMVLRTIWGWGWLLQFVAAVVIAVALRRVRNLTTEQWRVAAAAALTLAFTPALSGHASSDAHLSWLAITADAAHVIGAGGWLGGLFMVLAAGIPAALRLPEGERGLAVTELVTMFSPTALFFAGLVATTGIFAAWLHIGSVPGLWESRYGRTLLLKLGALSVVAATGAYNWQRVKPALGDTMGTRRLRRSATLELAVAALVVVVTAVLVATPTPRDDSMVDMQRGVGSSLPTDTL